MFIKDSQLLRRALQKYKWVIITTTVINESKLLRECKVCNERRGKEMGEKKNSMCMCLNLRFFSFVEDTLVRYQMILYSLLSNLNGTPDGMPQCQGQSFQE